MVLEVTQDQEPLEEELTQVTITDLQAIAEGSDEAYARVYTFLFPRFVARAMTLLNNDKSEAENVTQDALLKIKKSAGECRGNVNGWLFSILRNVALDVGRRRGLWIEKQSEIQQIWGDGTTTSEQRGPDEISIQRDQFAVVRKAMSVLNQTESEVMRLLIWEDLKNGEVAKRMGLNQSTISNLKRDALIKMREVLPQDEFEAISPHYQN